MVVPKRFRHLMSAPTLYRNGRVTVLDCHSGEKRVLKITDCSGSDKMLEKAARECTVMWELRGLPGVLRVYDYEIDRVNKVVYLVVEKSLSLCDYLAWNLIDLTEIPIIGAGLCEALIQCRDRGVLHLDVSARNVYYDRSKREVKLGDFNSIKSATDPQVLDSVTGTIKYMAPETYNSRIFDERSLVYSVGMLLYTMCNGGLPAFCPCPDTEDPVRKRMSGEEELPMPQYAEQYPEHLERLGSCLVKACSFDPAKRYRNLESLLDAISRAGFDTFLALPAVRVSAAYGDKDTTVLTTDPERTV